jgi:hypothetical protein
MRWELSEEQELFTTSLREWLGQRAEPAAVRDWLDAGDLSSFERLLTGEGWAGVGFAEELGGQGGGLLELALTARELGRVAAPSASWLQSAIAVPALADEPALMQAACESGELTALALRADRIPAATPSVESGADRLHGRIPCVLGASRCGCWMRTTAAWGFTRGRCWIGRATPPISPLMTYRHGDSTSTRGQRSPRSLPGQRFWWLPMHWAHRNGCSN